MGIDLNKTLKEVHSGGAADLDRVEQFLATQGDDDDAGLVREAIKAKRGPQGADAMAADQLGKRFDQGSDMSQDELAAGTMEGVGQAGAGLLPSQEDMQRQSGTLGMAQDPALAGALEKRSAAIYDRTQANMGRSARLGAADKQFKRTAENVAVKRQESQIAQEVYKQKYQKYVDDKAARASILGTLLGIGGTILGGILTGGASVAVQGAVSGVSGAVGGALGSAGGGGGGADKRVAG